MSRKRDKPYFSRQERTPYPKRHRPVPPPLPTEDKLPPPPALLVTGLSPDCSVLDLKSRFEIYGSISRIRIDRDGVGHVTYRSNDSAQAAISASLDPSFGITLHSKRVEVLRSTDPLAQWREGVGVGGKKESGSTSKLLRAEIPLSRRGRGNKLASAIVNPRSSSSDDFVSGRVDQDQDVAFKGREIIAYDDIL
ncbi:homeobox protein 54 [Euphorbia peplus]|nr:homeobox protein 54 [Euphorbia peplus]